MEDADLKGSLQEPNIAKEAQRRTEKEMTTQHERSAFEEFCSLHPGALECKEFDL